MALSIKTILLIASTSATLVAVYISAYTLNRRKVKGAAEFSLFMLCVAVYCGGYTLELLQDNLESLLAVLRFEYIGVEGMYYFWLLFALTYTRPRPLSRGAKFLLALPSAILLFIVWTNDFHGFYFSSAYLDYRSGYPALGIVISPGYVIGSIYTVAALLSGSVILMRFAAKADRWTKYQALAIGIGATFPALVYLIRLSGIIPFYIDTGPFSALPSALVFAFLMFNDSFFELVPKARSIAMEELRDGIVVLDTKGRIADSNPAARSFLGELKLGTMLEDNPGIPPEMVGLVRKGAGSIILDSSQSQTLSALSFSVKDEGGGTLGTAMLIRDETEITELVSRLSVLATTDELTGLKNRRNFLSVLENRFASALEGRNHFSVAILDLDDFKHVNDTYGHFVGDDVLRGFARILSDFVGSGRSDFGAAGSGEIACRYGGEEFAILLPALDPTQAFERIESLRKLVESSVFGSQGHPIRITLSIGLACGIPGEEATLDNFLSKADEALYKAKRSGKNRTMAHLA
ncbi:MAG: histidine kinase N-terminal 7TM domain-containing protein [Spirochaetota bacterium]